MTASVPTLYLEFEVLVSVTLEGSPVQNPPANGTFNTVEPVHTIYHRYLQPGRLPLKLNPRK